MRSVLFRAAVLCAGSLVSAAGNCVCNGLSHGRPGAIGTKCARWDAPDERPWCYIKPGACGKNTFESRTGVFWSHEPCLHVPASELGTPAAGASTGSAPGGTKRIGIAITLTKDGDHTGYLDGAAVLKQSVVAAKSKYDIDMIAIVHPSVQKSRAFLVKLGYIVVEKKWPFTSAGIKRKHLRETIDKSGCCGMSELIKLGAWEFEQYHRVMLLDSDSLVMHNLDEVFDQPEDFLYTYDRNMDGSWSKKPPVQGGFFVLKPSKTKYHTLVELVREGDFREGTGWGGKGIGWCYGGQTVQGLLSYYANIILPQMKGTAKEMDSAIYNNMASNVNFAGRKQNTVPAAEIKLAHFTTCQKPWTFCGHGGSVACEGMLKAWWGFRADFEKIRGISLTKRCGDANGGYVGFNFDKL